MQHGQRLRGLLRPRCLAISLVLFTTSFACQARAHETQPACALSADAASLNQHEQSIPIEVERSPDRLIVIGFMGGRVHANNNVHREALLIRNLQQQYPLTINASLFANRNGYLALSSVLHQLDRKHRGCLTSNEKASARIIIFGHSWGASQSITLARQLNALDIPVLLTIQVDSVQKARQNDALIPPNVHEAINFYQSEGWLRGRSLIAAENPDQTKILGNFASSYRDHPISCDRYPWYARLLMKQHIEIENDPALWTRIETLITNRIS